MGAIIPCVMHTKMWVHIIHAKYGTYHVYTLTYCIFFIHSLHQWTLRLFPYLGCCKEHVLATTYLSTFLICISLMLSDVEHIFMYRLSIHMCCLKSIQRHFSRRKQKADRHMKQCSMPLIVREMKIRPTMWYHLTHVRMHLINKTASSGEGVEKKEP